MRHVAVKGVVRRVYLDLVLIDQFFSLKNWLGHFKPKGFGLVGARNNATIVIRKYNYGHAFECRIKNPLARNVKVVTVD
jgi:hypothetical protein